MIGKCILLGGWSVIAISSFVFLVKLYVKSLDDDSVGAFPVVALFLFALVAASASVTYLVQIIMKLMLFSSWLK